jgi:hypothetical protein
MLFVNKIDHIRKLGDLIACVVFLLLGFYLYKLKYYRISLFLFICGIFDLVFTYDAIKLHGLCNILNIKLLLS